MRRLLLAVSLVALAALAVTGAALGSKGSGGVTGPSIYVNGVLYRTVGTPTDLSGTGAPDRSFDTIYDFAMLQPNVATAAPGDPGFNGGRWKVYPVLFNSSYEDAVMQHDLNGSGDIDTNEELDALFADPDAGGATAGDVVKSFECPLIKQPRNA